MKIFNTIKIMNNNRTLKRENKRLREKINKMECDNAKTISNLRQELADLHKAFREALNQTMEQIEFHPDKIEYIRRTDHYYMTERFKINKE